MEVFSNIWKHPKTSAVGLLIGIVTVASVLSQQGITLGTAGTGTVVSLIAAVATALLGLLARDPASNPTTDTGSSSSSTAKLGAWMLIAVLLSGVTFSTAGCNSSSCTLKSETAVLAEALTNLSTALSSEDATASTALATAASGLTAVVNNWDTSTAATKIGTIAAGVETVLASIPSTSKYTALVAIAVTAVEAIVSLTSSSSTSVSARRVSAQQEANLAYLRVLGKQSVQHRFGRSIPGDYKAAWNRAISDGHLNVLPIK
jgi:hypothetical protein